MEGDWGNMHQDMLDLILSNLFGEDQHIFSLVCSSWHKALLASPHRHTPCLINDQKSNHLLRFFPHNDTFFYECFPNELQNAKIRFANHGWLLMKSRENNTIFFFDPFNNNPPIHLPIPPSYRHYTTICFFHPPTSPECFVVGIESKIHNSRHAAFIGLLRRGEGEWKDYPYLISKEFPLSLVPPVLNQGLVYFVDIRGNVATFNINKHCDYTEAWSVYDKCLRDHRLRKDYKIKFHYLIKPDDDEDSIFAVFVMREERHVRVFKLLESTISWEPVYDLGEKVFFVSNTSSSGYTTRVKTMANKIFFPKLYNDKFVYYSLDTEKYHSYDGTYSSRGSFGIKRLDFATWTMATQQLINTRDELRW